MQRSGRAEEQGSQEPLRTLVLGLGNPILRDDGVGWRVAEEVAQAVVETTDYAGESALKRTGESLQPAEAGLHLLCQPVETGGGRVECDCVSLGGLALMERLVGYDRVVLVDAIQTRGGTPGAVYRLALDDLPTMHADAAHDATFKAALELGRRLGVYLPDDVAIVAVEAEDVLDFGEGLSPAVEAAVPQAVRLILETLNEMKADLHHEEAKTRSED